MIDVDNSGEIEFSEFITATVNRFDLLSDKKLKKAFDTYDLDKSGKINAQELKQALGNDSLISDDVWVQILKQVDLDGDGEISFDEFKIMMFKLLEEKK